jgi:hypothetical protein
MLIPRKDRLRLRDTEMLQNAILQCAFECLAIGTNSEMFADEVEHDASPRPRLIFCVPQNAVLRAQILPYVVMSMWAGEEASVSLRVGQGAAMRDQDSYPALVSHEPVRADTRTFRILLAHRREHLAIVMPIRSSSSLGQVFSSQLIFELAAEKFTSLVLFW